MSDSVEVRPGEFWFMMETDREPILLFVVGAKPGNPDGTGNADKTDILAYIRRQIDAPQLIPRPSSTCSAARPPAQVLSSA